MGLGGRLGSIWQSGGPACGAWMRNQPITPDKLLMARRPRSRPTLVSIGNWKVRLPTPVFS